jgi:hypothetical protein
MKREIPLRVVKFWVLGMAFFACANDVQDDDTDVIDDPPVVQLDTCEVPDDLGGDPLMETGSNGPSGLVHIVDVVADTDGRVYATGAGGLMTFAYTDGDVELLGHFKGQGTNGTNLEVLDNQRIALSSKRGFRVFDMADPDAPQALGGGQIGMSSGLAWDGSYLYVLTMEGTLLVYDNGQGSTPVASLDGFDSPSEIVLVGEKAYVADNLSGIHVLDLSNPTDPTRVTTFSGDGGAQDIATDGAYLYVAAGSVGIEVFSIEGRDKVASLSYGSAIVAVDVADERLWATNHEDVVVVDVSDPENPLPLAMEKTPEWSLNVVGVGNTAFVGDWSEMRHYTLEDIAAPEADPSSSELYFYLGSAERTFEIANRGSDVLEIDGFGVDDDRFTLEFSGSRVQPGESVAVTLTFVDDGEPVDAGLCIVTNDPDEPIQEIALASTSSSSAIVIGEQAQDFTLQDLDGNSHTLSQQLGQPVVLVYFATW